MSYTSGTPNGRLYVGSVKWTSDYKHVVDFDNTAARDKFFQSHLRQLSNKIIYANPNQYIDVRGTVDGLKRVNYCYFKPDDTITDEWFCCFVTDWEFLAPNTTRLMLKMDVFQTYFYDTNFYRTLIKRGHVASDSSTAWLAPEPFKMIPQYEREIGTILSNDQWEPTYICHMASKYIESSGSYEYGGSGEDNTFGEYGTVIESITDMRDLLADYGKKSLDQVAEDVGVSSGDNKYSSIIGDLLTGAISSSIQESIERVGTAVSAWLTSGLTDHRDELIGLYARPTWAKGSGSDATNEVITASASLGLKSSLACGYTPRNKKMLSSMCNAYVVYNRNGFKLPLQPELFSGNPTFDLRCVPMDVGCYYMTIRNYNKPSDATKQISYACERRVGYDNNTGLNKTLNVLSAAVGLLGSAATVGAGVATGGIGLAAAGGALGGFIGNSVNMVEAIGQQGVSFGSNGDLIGITAGNATLHFIQISPLYAECEYIDDFLDMYGYEIDEIGAVRSWIRTRPNWNFLQTDNVSCEVPAPSIYADELRAIFNNGVTLWHNYNTFGDYSQNNRPA